MIAWDYNPENFGKVYLIPEGEYRVRIEEANEEQSKSGKPMIKLTLKISGENLKLWSYIVLDNSTPESKAKSDNRLGSVWNSFDIDVGNFNLENWKNKIGGAKIVQRDNPQTGEKRNEIAYFIRRDKQEKLSAWREGKSGVINPDMLDFTNEDVPF